MTVLDQALALAARGIPVFPCLDNKSPATSGGFKAASTSPDAVRDMFAGGASLIGVPTGAASGLDVLDLDPRHGSDAWWNAHANRIPATLIHETRSGGKHIVFRHQPGLRCSTGRVGPGCDIRANGGYVVWWPAAAIEVWLDEEPAPWPVWLLADVLADRPAVSAEPVDATRLAPPSVAAVVDLLTRLPNPLDMGRDGYVRVMTASSYCARVMGDDDGAIEDAAVDWAERWDGGSEHDERAKWRNDWSRRDAPRAGWQTLQAEACRLIPGYRAEIAEADFLAIPMPVAVVPRRRVIAPGECDGVTSRPYRVKGLLAERDVACLFGPPGAGKSLLGPLLAYRIAQGEPFFGLRTRAGPTLYVAAEDESGMERRVSALRLAHGDAPGFGLVKGVSDLLNSTGDMEWLRAEVQIRRPALIVIDTLAMAFPGLIENDADAMGRVVAVARQLTEHSAAVLLIHHDSKARDGTPRGHSLLNGALDVAISLDPKDGNGVVRGQLTKNRNGSCEHDVAFMIGVQTLGHDQDGDPVTAAMAVELCAEDVGSRQRLPAVQAKALQALHDTLSASGQIQVPESAWRVACDARALTASDNPDSQGRTFRRAAGDLVAAGIVVRLDGQVWLADRASGQAGQARTSPDKLDLSGGRFRTDTDRPLGLSVCPPCQTLSLIDLVEAS